MDQALERPAVFPERKKAPMSLWLERKNELTHYQDRLHEAEQYRLVHKALAGRPRKPKIYCTLLNWLGSRLSTWGDQLQERYGAAPASWTCCNSFPQEIPHPNTHSIPYLGPDFSGP